MSFRDIASFFGILGVIAAIYFPLANAQNWPPFSPPPPEPIEVEADLGFNKFTITPVVTPWDSYFSWEARVVNVGTTTSGPATLSIQIKCNRALNPKDNQYYSQDYSGGIWNIPSLAPGGSWSHTKDNNKIPYIGTFTFYAEIIPINWTDYYSSNNFSQADVTTQ